MALRFTDQHAMSLVSPALFPGEQVLFRARGFEKPWFAYLLFRIGALFWRYWLVVATNQRVLFVHHGGLLSGFASKRGEAFAWQDVDHVGVGWGFLSKKLVVRSRARHLSRKIIIPRGWMRGNFPALEGIATTWRQNGVRFDNAQVQIRQQIPQG